LAPLAIAVHLSVYFGMWARLQERSPIPYQPLNLILLPFLASLSASVASYLPNKFRAFCFQINLERSKSVEKRYRKETVELRPTSQLLLEYITSKDFRIERMEVMAVGYGVLKNWLTLSLFAAGQWWVEGGKSI
jgi:hypothetical protein